MALHFQIARGQWRAWISVILLASGLVFCLDAADPPSLSEFQVKAAFLYNFAKFVEWPSRAFASPESPLILDVVGDDPMSKNINAITGRMVGTHRIQVEWFPISRANLFIQNPPECHILYLLPSERLQTPAIIQAVRLRNVLTVCDGVKNFSHAGAAINLVTTPENKIQFEINVDAAKRAGLKIESPLLNLARIVREPNPTN